MSVEAKLIDPPALMMPGQKKRLIPIVVYTDDGTNNTKRTETGGKGFDSEVVGGRPGRAAQRQGGPAGLSRCIFLYWLCLDARIHVRVGPFIDSYIHCSYLPLFTPYTHTPQHAWFEAEEAELAGHDLDKARKGIEKCVSPRIHIHDAC